MRCDFEKHIDRCNTGSYKWDWRTLIFGTEDVLPMSIADMDLPIPEEVQLALKERLDHPVMGYTVKTDNFYNAVKRWMKKRHDWDVSQEWISSTPGIVPAINFAIMGLTEPGDGVIIQPPVYNPFFESIKLNGRKLLCNNLIENQTDSPNKIFYSIDFADFEEKAKEAKLFILCSPHNPVGRVWTQEELCKLGRICKRYGVKIISDEIHNDLVFKPNKHIPFSSIEEFADISVTCMAPSKTFNVAGLCTSIMIIPNSEIKAVFEDVMMKTGIFMMNIFGLKALEACYNECEIWLEELLTYLEVNKNYVHDFIQKELPMLKVSDSESTFLAWIDFNALGMTHSELECFLVNKAKIGLDTGLKYGENAKGYMRINFGCTKKVLENAMLRLKNAVESLENR